MALDPIINPAVDDVGADALYDTANKINYNDEYLLGKISQGILDRNNADLAFNDSLDSMPSTLVAYDLNVQIDNSDPENIIISIDPITDSPLVIFTEDATGSGNDSADIEVVVTDYSHLHIIDNVDGLQTVLDERNNIIQSYYHQAPHEYVTGSHIFNFSLGDMQKITVVGDVNLFTQSFMPGRVCQYMFQVVDGGSFAVGWPNDWEFGLGIAPTLSVTGIDSFMLLKDKNDVFSLFELSSYPSSVL